MFHHGFASATRIWRCIEQEKWTGWITPTNLKVVSLKLHQRAIIRPKKRVQKRPPLLFSTRFVCAQKYVQFLKDKRGPKVEESKKDGREVLDVPKNTFPIFGVFFVGCWGSNSPNYICSCSKHDQGPWEIFLFKKEFSWSRSSCKSHDRKRFSINRLKALVTGHTRQWTLIKTFWESCTFQSFFQSLIFLFSETLPFYSSTK